MANFFYENIKKNVKKTVVMKISCKYFLHVIQEKCYINNLSWLFLWKFYGNPPDTDVVLISSETDSSYLALPFVGHIFFTFPLIFWNISCF